ncbi:MAG: carboxypeptidase-like regulatory domain-containing protein [Bacteroidota bacterium]|nr:carboxypeptidase-like regulatory domain-containing protein [Bacteroidota bacterium]
MLASVLSGSSLQAQPTRIAISGMVTDEETGVPLTGAHVFIASSMVGTTTDLEGRYALDNVPLGAHRLYVSMLGFEDDFLDIMVRTSEPLSFDFRLTPAVLSVGEITVEAEQDRRWRRRLERFTREFIGETPNAQVTTILNPEVLDFENSGGTFRAVAASPLLIENRALGYRVQYFLRDFESIPGRVKYDGEGLYEELEPESLEQAQQWEAKRREAFMGSFRHFLLALIAGRTEAQGFMTYSRPSTGGGPGDSFSAGSAIASQRFPLDPGELLSPSDVPNEYILDFEGHLEIVYTGETEDPAYQEWRMRPERSNPRFQTSWTFLNHGPALVDYKGDTLDPYAVVFMGYLAFQRVANEPPREYRPGGSN